jgi:hypothetical protein
MSISSLFLSTNFRIFIGTFKLVSRKLGLSHVACSCVPIWWMAEKKNRQTIRLMPTYNCWGNFAVQLEWLAIGLWLAICIIPIIASSGISGFFDTVAASPEHLHTRQAISTSSSTSCPWIVCTYVREIMTPAHVLRYQCHLTEDTNGTLPWKSQRSIAYVSLLLSLAKKEGDYSFKATTHCLLLTN